MKSAGSGSQRRQYIMGRLQDQDYLRNHQYKDDAKLGTRIKLHRLFSTNQYSWFRWVFDHLTIPSEVNLLELGCGPGDLWLENMDRIPQDWTITLTDFSKGMVERAAQNLHSQPHVFQYGVVDAQRIPFPDQSFETVIGNHMFFHVPDRLAALKEILRVTKPEGTLFATTVGETHMCELPELVLCFDPSLAEKHDQEENEFTLESGYKQLSNVFSDVRVYRQENHLRITEPEPLVDYVLSDLRLGVSEHRRAEFTDFIEQEMLENEGCIRIMKDNGMLVAS
jgi:ubiquinone/menaquinone biosynthesis C-methylase UbiE